MKAMKAMKAWPVNPFVPTSFGFIFKKFGVFVMKFHWCCHQLTYPYLSQAMKAPKAMKATKAMKDINATWPSKIIGNEKESLGPAPIIGNVLQIISHHWEFFGPSFRSLQLSSVYPFFKSCLIIGNSLGLLFGLYSFLQSIQGKEGDEG